MKLSLNNFFFTSPYHQGHGGHGHHQPSRGRGASGRPRPLRSEGQDREEPAAVLVLGAGFQGQPIAAELARRGLTVYIFDPDTGRALATPTSAFQVRVIIMMLQSCD